MTCRLRPGGQTSSNVTDWTNSLGGGFLSGGVDGVELDANGVPVDPTAPAAYAHDYPPVAADNPVGDNAVAQEDLAEGGIYVLSALDMGVYDPDDADSAVTYNIRWVSVYDEARLELNTGTLEGAGLVLAHGNTFTAADLRLGKLRVVHLGSDPSGTLSFGYTVKDDESAQGAVQTVTIDVRPVNDVPSALSLGINRIDPLHDPVVALATMTTTDEETTDQAAFTYALVADEDTDYRWFKVSGRELLLKSAAELRSAGENGEDLLHKLEGETYSLKLTVTDVGNGTAPDQLANVTEFAFNLPVRSFDVDWNTASAGVQPAPLTVIDLATESGTAKTIGTFKIDAGAQAKAGDTFAVLVSAAGNDYADTFTATQDGSDPTLWTIGLTPNPDSPPLQELRPGQTLNINFTLEIRYTPEGSTDADGFRRSTDTFTVQFVGQDEPPVAVHPDRIVFEDLAKDGTANGDWGFTDPDTGTQIEARGLLASVGAGSTPVAQALIVDPDNAAYDATAEQTLAGSYGTFYIRADGTWRYLRDDTAIQAVPRTDTTETLRLAVSTDGAQSQPLDIDIMIQGENDAPVFNMNANSGDTTLDDDTGDLSAAVTETTTNSGTGAEAGYSDSHLTQGAAQTHAGRWAAEDVDEGSVMRLFIGATELGVVSGAGATARSYNGRYGDITFNTDGTWQYVLTARAETIAAGETPVEQFNVTVQDEYGEVSNRITLDITVTGTNDDPTDLSGDTSGAVAESGHRADPQADYTVGVDNLATVLPTTEKAIAATGRAGNAGEILVAAVELGAGGNDIQVNFVSGSGAVLSATVAGKIITIAISSDTYATNIADFMNAHPEINKLVRQKVDGLDVPYNETSRPNNITLSGGGPAEATKASLSVGIVAVEAVDAGPEGNDITLVFTQGPAITTTVDAAASTITVTLPTRTVRGDEIANSINAVAADLVSVTAVSAVSVVLTEDNDIYGTYKLAGGLIYDERIEEYTDLAANDVLGAPLATGTFDARDIDRVDTNGQPFGATDLHSFEVLGASGQTTRHADVVVTDPDTAIATNPRLYDADTTAAVTTAFKGTYGTLSVNFFTGAWTYLLDNTDTDTRALRAEDTVTDVFAILVTDEEGATHADTLTITVTGQEDAPVITVVATPDVTATEAGTRTDSATNVPATTASGKFDMQDDDSDDTTLGAGELGTEGRAGTTGDWTNGSGATVQTTGGAQINGTYGHLYLGNDGSWRYVLDDARTATQALDQGDKVTDSFQLRISDDSDALYSNVVTLAIDITGTNDAPVLTKTDTDVSVTEGGTASGTDVTADLTATGSLTIADVDADDTNTSVDVFLGTSAASQTTELALNSTSAPIAGTGASTAITDASYGDFTFTRAANGDVSWAYALVESRVSGLGAGDSATDKVWVKLTDTQSADSNVVEITVTITGTEDKPVLTANQSDDVTEAGGVDNATSNTTADHTVSGAFTVTDEDADDTGFAAAELTLQGRIENTGSYVDGSDTANTNKGTKITGTYGDFYLKADGNWSYELDNTRTATQELDDGGSQTDVLQLQVTDSDGVPSDPRTVTVTVTGTNDAPVLQVQGTGSSISDTTSNVADDAGTTVSTSVSEWWGRLGGGNEVISTTSNSGGTETQEQVNTVRDAHLAALTDGNTSNSATHDSTNYPYAEAPVTQFHTVASSAHSVTFDLDGTFATGSIVVWNRNAGSDAHQQRINGTTVELFKDGTSVWTSAALNRTQEDADDKITVTPPADIQFDEVRLNFPGNDQNLREVQIFGAEVTSGATIDAGATQAVSVAENIATSTAVLDFAAVDVDAADTLSYSVSGTDAADFSIDRSTGVLTFAAAPDYETPADADTDNVYNITVSVSDGTVSDSTDVAVTVTNANDAVPVVTRTGTQATLSEGTFASATNTGYSYSATDADGGTPALSVSGDTRFEIVGGVLRIKAGSSFDYETAADRSIDLTVTAADTGTGSGTSPGKGTDTVTITFGNVNDTVPVITRTGTQATLNEGSFASATNTGYSYSATDADGGTPALSVSGDNRFEIVGGVLRIKAGSSFDYETAADRSIDLTVTAADTGTGTGTSPGNATETVTITIGAVDEGDAVYTVTGTLESGEVLTASQSTADPDGLTGTVSYQWQSKTGNAAWADISGATAATYTLKAGDVGKQIRVQVSYTDGGGTSESLTITPSGTVAAGIDWTSGTTATAAENHALSAKATGSSGGLTATAVTPGTGGNAIRVNFEAGKSDSLSVSGNTITFNPHRHSLYSPLLCARP